MRARVLAVGLMLVTAGCTIDPYDLGGGRNGQTHDARVAGGKDGAGVTGRDGGGAAGLDGGGGGIDASSGNCEPERCDGLDNDCDGIADNGFNFAVDPGNCGKCGEACNKGAANQRGACAGGSCSYACAPGFLDCSGALPGCEYACIATNGGVEACDGLDNDCDCQTDEGFETQSDPLNCGACNHVCVALHATPTCAEGMCGVGACDPGFKDFDPEINGCEYRCPVFPPKSKDDSCDGVDDDCDGVADEDVPGIGASCSTALPGECAAGRQTCVNGSVACVAVKVAQPELCDGKDDDCNGTADNGYDKQSDPNHCGAGCAVCSFPHAVAGCIAGRCKYLACDAGWTDRFPDDQFPGSPGCDFQCTPTGAEICDGVDNDCNGKIDEDDPGLIRPANFCNQQGTCVGATLTCATGKQGCSDAAKGWRCKYPTGTELDACGNLVAQETLCDGLDGDCDHVADDAFAGIGSPCGDGKKGVCASSGKLGCDPADAKKTTLVCKIDHAGGTAGPELCNGLDDDCNGVVDNGASDNMVHVVSGGMDFSIQAYEASHPDATADTLGTISDHACANPGVLPWSQVSWTEADTVCRARGLRLCSEAQWQAACGGSAGTTYPYGASYDDEACNGNDFNPACGGEDEDEALPGGTAYGCPPPAQSRCVSTWGTGKIFDMSGNLREWTGTAIGAFKRIRGGAYDNVSQALTCKFDFWAESPDSFFYNLGFRCCTP